MYLLIILPVADSAIEDQSLLYTIIVYRIEACWITVTDDIFAEAQSTEDKRFRLRLHQAAVLVSDYPLHTTTTDHVLFACFVAVVAPASRQARGRVAEQRVTATKKGTRAEHKLRL